MASVHVIRDIPRVISGLPERKDTCVSIHPGDMRPQINDRFGKVIRVANAAWTASRLSSEKRYEFVGWFSDVGEYFVHDWETGNLVSLSELYDSLPPARRKAVWL